MSFKYYLERNVHVRVAGFFLFGGLVTSAVASGVAGEWKYITAPARTGAVSPILQTVLLSDDRPKNLTEDVEYQGKRRLYAQLRYGSPNSVRVAIVVDQRDSGQVDLYLDANRNRIIQSKERLPGSGPRWEVPLDVAIVGEGTVVESFHRVIVIERGVLPRTLAVGTLGYMEGTVKLNGQTFAARRVDGNANGTFADLQDRLWIERDGDGRWNPFTEQFPFAPTLRIDSKSYAARTDALGHRLTLQTLEGTGKVRLTIPKRKDRANPAEVVATLVGRDGTAVQVAGLDRPVEVPVGEYRLATVFLTLQDKQRKRVWNFLFSATSGQERPWHEVKKGQALSLNPIGNLKLTAEFEEGETTAKPGSKLTILPKLYTGDRLLITTCYFGSDDSYANQPKAKVTLRTNDGKRFDSATCDFF